MAIFGWKKELFFTNLCNIYVGMIEIHIYIHVGLSAYMILAST